VAIRKAAVAGIFVPNMPGAEGRVTALSCGVGSMVTCFVKDKRNRR
jgi:hypothetical protein